MYGVSVCVCLYVCAYIIIISHAICLCRHLPLDMLEMGNETKLSRFKRWIMISPRLMLLLLLLP